MDPHSEYIKPEILNEVNENLQGSFHGIGVSFRIEKDTITILNTIKGGPSEKVGLMAGDRIIYVGDSLVAGNKVTNKTAMSLLKGERGTKINVKIKRRGIDELLGFTITRDVIPTHSVDVAYMIDNNIGFIKLNKFSQTTHKEFVDAIRKLQKEGMTQLILDLRGNTGGYLGEAVGIADEMLKDNNLIVYTEGEHRDRSYIFSRHRGLWENNDVVVLIDEGSASASEIVAGALQDNDRGTIIGRRSFGKGLVQEQFDLADNGAVRLTVARYYTPTGRCIQKPFSGTKEEYLLEELTRYETGEMFNADSIHFADSLKYITPKGKIVYGGGGIMPDYFIPRDTAKASEYLYQLRARGLIYNFAIDYTNAHRDEMYSFDTKSLIDYLKGKSFLSQLKDYASKKGLKPQSLSNVESTIVERETKAYIGRNLQDNEAFYPIINEEDPAIEKAVELLSAE